MRVRRGACAAALLLAVAAAAPAAAATAEPSVVFEVVTTAVGTSVSSTQRPAASVVTGGLVDSSTGYATSALSSAGASASASAAIYPGDLVATGPTLLCSEFLPCPFSPPAYPLLAQASWPERPAASADSPTPVGKATASARELVTQATTEITRAAAPGTPVAVTVAAQSTSTKAWADAAGGHVRAVSTLHDVAVGPLHIALLAATEVVDVSPLGQVSDRPQVQLSGVTFAGLAASVDSGGVHLLGVSEPLPNRQLAAEGVEIRALGTTKDDAKGAARSTAGGLQVTFSAPVQGVPPLVPGLPSADRSYLGSLLVGGAGAAVGVGAPGAPLLEALPPPSRSSLATRLLGPSGIIGGDTPASAGAGTPALTAGDGGSATSARRPLLPQPDLRWLALALFVVPTSLLLLWRLGARRRPL